MAVHDHHERLPGYDPAAIFHPGCDECEHRAKDIQLVLAFTDASRLHSLWLRGAEGQHSSLDHQVYAELRALKHLCVMAREKIPTFWVEAVPDAG